MQRMIDAIKAKWASHQAGRTARFLARERRRLWLGPTYRIELWVRASKAGL